jgi:hypothetical protein
MHRRTAAAILVAAILSVAGCGGSATGEVSGTAAFEGVPIEDGSITFFPADGKGPTAGDLIKNGKYHVKNVPVGTAKVQITSNKEAGKKKLYNTPNSPEQAIFTDPLPEKYKDPLKTELRFDVQAGANEKNWDLKK